jgi:hypothetical protein
MLMGSTAPPSAESLKPLFDLISLFVDLDATKERIGEFIAAEERARTLTESAEAAQAALAAAETSSRDKLEAARTEHEAAIRDAQQKFDQERLTAENALLAREKRQAEAEAKLQVDADAVAALKEDLERRLTLLRSVSAA